MVELGWEKIVIVFGFLLKLCNIVYIIVGVIMVFMIFEFVLDGVDFYLWFEDVIGVEVLDWVCVCNKLIMVVFCDVEFEWMCVEVFEVFDIDV